MPETLHGLNLTVLRPADGADSTLGGVSGQHQRLTLIGTLGTIDGFGNQAVPLRKEFWGPAEPDADAPAVALQVRVIGEPVLNIVPVFKDITRGTWDTRAGFMAGGNFAYTTDSRFNRLCESLLGHRFYGAVAVHDRFEFNR